MQRSDALIKFISVIVFIVLAVYMGAAFLNGREDSLKTVLAVDMELREGIYTEGYAVREEEQVSSSDGSASVTAAEGEKVASGETLAVSFSGDSALQRAESIRELTIQIEQLEAMQSGASSSQTAKDSILSLSKAVAGRDLSNLDAILLNINSYITDEGLPADTGNIESTLTSLKLQLKSLQATSSGTRMITAEYSGTFSSFTDGFESISPEDLTSSTMPDEIRAMFASPKSVGSGVFGKLVSGIKWYYVTIMDKQSASKLSGASTVSVAFSRTYSGTISMKVESIGVVSDDGECVVVLSSSKYLQDVIAVRDMTAEIVLSASGGIQVPREAMHIDDNGQTYIYILKGLLAERVNVEIIGESADYYMVAKGASGLKIGDEIITQAAELYDGAVVAK